MANKDNQPVTPDSGPATATAPAPADVPYYVANPNAEAAPSPASADAPSAAAPAAPAAAPADAPPPQQQYDQQTATMPYQQPPPEKHMFQKIYDGVLTALGGAKTVTFSMPDPKTGQIVKHEDPATPGQQWKRIIAGALSGLAASGGAGTGPGQKMRGLALGVQGGFQAADRQQAQEQQQRQEMSEDFQRQQQTKFENARTAALTQEVSLKALQMTHENATAMHDYAMWNSELTDLISSGGKGSVDLGIVRNGKDLMALKEKMADVQQHQADGRIITRTNFTPDGKFDGTHYAWVTPEWKKTPTDHDVTVPIYEPGKDPKHPVKTTQTFPAGSQTQGEAADAIMHYSNEALKVEHQIVVDEETEKKDKTEREHMGFENRNLEAEAGEHDAKTQQIKGIAEAGQPGGLIDLIGKGQLGADRLMQLAAKNPDLMNAVHDRYPDFDAGRIRAYGRAYEDFTSGKPGSTGAQLLAAGTALEHLKELRDLNTSMSHVPHTAAWTKYMNKVDTLASELGAFYHTTTIPAIKAIKDTLASTLPNNREAAISTQTQSMGDRIDNYRTVWNNAAPSAAYEAKMPDISEKGKEARAALDPGYQRRRVAELQGTPQAAAAGKTPPPPPNKWNQPGDAIQLQPGEEPQTNPQTGQRIIWRNNQWVDVKTGKGT